MRSLRRFAVSGFRQPDPKHLPLAEARWQGQGLYPDAKIRIVVGK